MFHEQSVLLEDNLWDKEFVLHCPKRVVLAVLCSLLNSIFNYDPVGTLPYNHLLFADPNEPVVLSCIQVLVGLLNCDAHKKELEMESLTPLYVMLTAELVLNKSIASMYLVVQVKMC